MNIMIRYYSVAVIFITLILFSISSCGKETRKTEIETNNVFVEENLPEEKANKTVYVIPLLNRSDSSLYPNAGIDQMILFNSFYTFISYLPGIKVPEKNNLLEFQSPDASLVSKEKKADYIISGDYIVEGSKSNQTIEINIRVSSRISGESFSNSYISPTDVEIFDTIDKISEDIGSFMLKEKTHVAHLSFGDFKTGPYEYDLTINGRHAALVTNESFSLSLNVLSGKTYHVELKRLLDSKKLISEDVVLNPGESTNISYREIVDCSIDFNGNMFFLGKKNINNSTNSLNNKKGGDTVNHDYLITGDRNIRLYIYSDAKSNLKLELSEKGEKKEKLLHMTGSSTGFAHLSIISGFLTKIEDTNTSIIRFRVNRVSGNSPYGIFINDYYGEEFYYSFQAGLTNNEWVQISLPLNKFKSRADWQYSYNINHKVDLPLSQVQIFANDGFFANNGPIDIYFDSLELVQ